MAPPVDPDEEVDALAAINAELRKADLPDDDDGPWLPLESNPEVFTDFAHKSGGLPKDWGWVDIFGLDRELLNMIPEPCAGVILLFPCTDNIFEVRREQKQRLLRDAESPATQIAYHVQQVAEFGNACGTIASVHALINGATVYNQDPNKLSALQKFRDGNENSSALDRGRALLKTSSLRSSSDQSASHQAAQTACPDRHGPDLDHHFVAFSPIPVAGGEDDEHIQVVELDGTKLKPVDHGSVASIILEDDSEKGTEGGDDDDDEDSGKHSFLRATARIIRKQYMEVEPDSIEFTMMALCKIK